MSNTSSSELQVIELKKKLDAAISSRSSLENDLKTQSSLLIDFIARLSQTCKGQDTTLDNKLANLRHLLKKSAPIADIEKQISATSSLLQKHSSTNDANIKTLHHDFLSAGQSLQKVKGLPPELRRNLRSLIQNNQDEKDAIVNYVPILRELVSFYIAVLRTKDSSIPAVEKELTQTSSSSTSTSTSNSFLNEPVNTNSFNKFLSLINALSLSESNTQHLRSVKAKVSPNMQNKQLLESFFDVFDVIVNDLNNERNTAKEFLSSLSETLTTVQSSVKSTLALNSASNKKHKMLNSLLQKQVGEMSTEISKATSLSSIQQDINKKLALIASTLHKKSDVELEQSTLLETKMLEMSSKVAMLEKESKAFKKRLKEQEIKSMEDALTKLANRACFDDYYAKALMKFQHKTFELAIVVFDLDDFKRINDTYGHTAGDKTLQVIANTLKKHIDENTFIARYGGEEFVMVMSKINKTDLVTRLNAIRKEIARLPFKFKNDKVSITVSVGVSHINKKDNYHTAFERADKALYKAKAQGKNQVIYDDN